MDSGKSMNGASAVMKSLVSGGIAGMCAKTAVAPLERLKILLQAQSKHYSHLGVFKGLGGIVQKEGVAALYKGNGAHMVRVFPYAAIKFASFEFFKSKFGGDGSHIGRLLAGSSAGVTAVTLTYPLDTIRARLSFQVRGEHVYNGMIECAQHIFKNEGGILGLYRGFVPTICTIIPYAGLQFYCFGTFRNICVNYFPDTTCKPNPTRSSGTATNEPNLTILYKLICGGMAGAVAQTVAYPMDVARRRMQIALMQEETKEFGTGMIHTLKLIYQENGIIRGYYRGMSINYIRAIPMAAVTFSVYEMLTRWMNE